MVSSVIACHARPVRFRHSALTTQGCAHPVVVARARALRTLVSVTTQPSKLFEAGSIPVVRSNGPSC